MPFLGSADERAGGHVQVLPEVGKSWRHGVDEFLWPKPRRGRGSSHVEAVLVHAGGEEHLVALQALETRLAVGADLFERMAKVRIPVGVIDRTGLEESGHCTAGTGKGRARGNYPRAGAKSIGAAPARGRAQRALSD